MSVKEALMILGFCIIYMTVSIIYGKVCHINIWNDCAGAAELACASEKCH